MTCKCRPNAGCVECQPDHVEGSPAWGKLVTNRIIDELEELILDCKCKYYCKGEPLVSDSQYDLYEDRLRKQRPDSWVLSAVGCPLCYKEGENEPS